MNFNNLAAALHGKRIFITGATGMFGKWLGNLFKLKNIELVLLTRNPEKFKRTFSPAADNSCISYVTGDIRDFQFPPGQFDYVIHAATPVDADDVGSSSDELYSIIADGTERVLKFAEEAGVGKFLYVSSGAVYGVQPPEIEAMLETLHCAPIDVYGKGKLRAEQLCLESPVASVITRCFSFVGPYFPLEGHFAMGNFIGSCLKNEPIEIKGDGTPMRSYMYSTDFEYWLLATLLHGGEGEVYNMGSDRGISISDLAFLIRQIAGTENEILIRKKPVPGAIPRRYVPSIDKSVRELGLTLGVSMEDAIEQTISWYRSH